MNWTPMRGENLDVLDPYERGEGMYWTPVRGENLDVLDSYERGEPGCIGHL